MTFWWVFMTRIGTRWQQSGLTVLRCPDARPTFLGDEVGALSLEQDAQQDDLAAQATALLKTDAAVSDGSEMGTKTPPGRPSPNAHDAEKNAALELRKNNTSLTPPSTRGHAEHS